MADISEQINKAYAKGINNPKYKSAIEFLKDSTKNKEELKEKNIKENFQKSNEKSEDFDER